MRLCTLTLMMALVAGGCVSPDADDDQGEDFVDGKTDTPRPLSYRRITSKAHFDAVAFRDGGVLIQGPSLKFLIDNRAPATPKIYFQNANYKDSRGQTPESARFHFPFGRAVLLGFAESGESFNQATYYKQEKRYVAGTIQSYTIGDATTPIYGIQFYPEDVIAEETVLSAVKVVKKAFRIPSAQMAFVATGPQQTTATVGAQLAAIPVDNLTIDKILGAIKYLPMNAGEAWGYLRIFPANHEELTPLDLPVFDELPLDLAVVAGVITRAFQDASAHVNLKSKERQTPDMVLRDAGPEHPRLAPFADQPVHLVVKSDGFVIEPTTDALVLAKFQARTNKPWIPIVTEPESRVLSFPEMCPALPGDCLKASKRFGGKAANLGFLTHRSVLGRVSDTVSYSKTLGYDLVPEGLGVPIDYYHQFVANPANATLKIKLDALIAAEKTGTLSPSQRNTMLKEVQQLFYAGQFPAGMLEAVKAKVTATLPGVLKIKVRSSANAEDLPNFDGAGLHDSFSANLSKIDNPDGSCQLVAGDGGVDTKLEMSPKTLACGLKGVLASVWNKRAIEERSFARLDHATVGMGIAIVPKYDNESPVVANAVVVSRVIGNEALYGYSFSTQKDNNLVTNPTPGTISENVVAAFSDPDVAPTFIVTRYATPVANQPPLTAPVLSNAEMQTMLDISRTVETAYCGAKSGYYPGACSFVTYDSQKPTALDFEFKLLANGQFVAKQVREFAGH